MSCLRRELSFNKAGRLELAQVFVKLMYRGQKYKEHDMFSFETKPDATVRDLIDALYKRHPKRFKLYLDDSRKRTLKRDTIVIVNGQNMVAHKGEETVLTEGDLVVFMIAAVGG